MRGRLFRSAKSARLKPCPTALPKALPYGPAQSLALRALCPTALPTALPCNHAPQPCLEGSVFSFVGQTFRSAKSARLKPCPTDPAQSLALRTLPKALPTALPCNHAPQPCLEGSVFSSVGQTFRSAKSARLKPCPTGPVPYSLALRMFYIKLKRTEKPIPAIIVYQSLSYGIAKNIAGGRYRIFLLPQYMLIKINLPEGQTCVLFVIETSMLFIC